MMARLRQLPLFALLYQAGSPGLGGVALQAVHACTADIVSLDYAPLPQEVQPGDTLYLNDGLVALRVDEVVDGTDIVTQVRPGGPLTSRKGINAPRVQLSTHVPTDKDQRDIQ